MFEIFVFFVLFVLLWVGGCDMLDRRDERIRRQAKAEARLEFAQALEKHHLAGPYTDRYINRK